MTLVKICGIQEERTIREMSGLPVDAIGFVFADSRRRVETANARRLVEVSRETPMADGKRPKTVGVFKNPTWMQLMQIMAEVPLDVIQLHGKETPVFCREVGTTFGVDVWRAFEAEEKRADVLSDYVGAVSTLLLDTAGGGTGKTFRWEIIPSYLKAAQEAGLQLYVAGGLTPDNVGELVADYRPEGVDISSGVETEGIKDIRKIAAFAERVKRA
jgi:phosphoribosylanthranilate isomerase